MRARCSDPRYLQLQRVATDTGLRRRLLGKSCRCASGGGVLYATTMFDGLGQFGGSLRSSLVLDQVSWLQMTATKRLP